jgi:predicted membrane protein
MSDYERNSGRELAGLIIILIGFALLMNTLNIFPMFPVFTLLHRFWLPGIFLVIGALVLSRRGPNDSPFAGVFFIFLGFLFLLSQMNWGFNFSRLIGPAILIWIGLMFLTRNSRNPNWRYRREERRAEWESRRESRRENRGAGAGFAGVNQSTDSSDFIHATAIFGGFDRKCPSQQFRGGSVTTVMGGGKIDLRDARMQGDEVVLDVFTCMGGIDIQVPPDWNVEPRFTPILGGFSDRRTSSIKQGTPRLVLHGTLVLGGINVSN